MTDSTVTSRKTTASWEDIAVFGAGFWLFLCPPTLGLHSSPVDMFGSVGAGVVTATVAGIAMRKDRLWAEWVIFAWGITMMMAPFALGFVVKEGIINMIACGIIASALAAWRIFDLSRRRRTAAATPGEASLTVEPEDDVRRAA